MTNFFSLGLIFSFLAVSQGKSSQVQDWGEKLKKLYSIDGVELGRSTITDVKKKWGGSPVKTLAEQINPL